jgi:hypothetical protein
VWELRGAAGSLASQWEDGSYCTCYYVKGYGLWCGLGGNLMIPEFRGVIGGMVLHIVV